MLQEQKVEEITVGEFRLFATKKTEIVKEITFVDESITLGWIHRKDKCTNSSNDEHVNIALHVARARTNKLWQLDPYLTEVLVRNNVTKVI